MKDKPNSGDHGFLERRLKQDAERLIASRSPGLGKRVLRALASEAVRDSSSAGASSGRPWRRLLPLLAACSLLIVLLKERSDHAHPAMRPSAGAPLGSAQLADGSFVLQLRGLIAVGQTLASEPVALTSEPPLLEREAKLLLEDVASLASEVIAGLPLAALPAAWQARLETL